MEEQRENSVVEVGTALGQYEILGFLGAGGMGEVYRARDLRLGREVALKMLSAGVRADPERLSRFRREAEILAALSHPNIGSIFGLEEEGGHPFLVLELVEGETLAERLGRGPLSTREAIQVGRMVAAALEAAHRRGVVHRDLKPANVKWGPEGRVRVLDFGLAVVADKTSVASKDLDISRSPTIPGRITSDGAILGTAPYMSPEQARGEDVDRRTDIWALGCLIFELLSGCSPFGRPTVGETLAAVLEREPDWTSLPPTVPDTLTRLLRRCLAKDLGERWHDAADVRIALDEILAEDLHALESEVNELGSRRFRTAITSALLTLALSSALFWTFKPDPPTSASASPVVRFSIRLPPTFQIHAGDRFNGPATAAAPDHSFVVYSAYEDGQEPRIYRRSIDTLESTPIAGAEGGRRPFVSPDSRWVGYYTADGALAKVPADGGLPQRIFGDERLMSWGGATWGKDGRIIFPRGLTGGLGVVSATGGEFEPLTAPDLDSGEIGHWRPQFLPDGKSLLFQSLTDEGAKNHLLDLNDGNRRTFDVGGFLLRYVDSGHLVWLDSGNIIAVAFDIASGLARSESKPVLSGVYSFDISTQGTLTYVTRPSGATGTGVAARWSKEGGVLELAGAGEGAQLRLSPDGRRLVIADLPHLWTVELERGVRSRLTTTGGLNNFPVWSADGELIAFNSLRGPHGIYVRSADGSGEARLVMKREGRAVLLPASWSGGGDALAITVLHPDGKADVSVIRLESSTLEPFVATDAREHSPAFSPDGRWLAYVSDETGRDEIYVRRYGAEGSRIAISTDGGKDPRWSRDGGRLLFRRHSTLFEVDVESGEELSPGQPRKLPELSSLLESTVPFGPTWDVAPDGELVYLRERPISPEPVEIAVVLGFSQELSRLVPADLP